MSGIFPFPSGYCFQGAVFWLTLIMLSMPARFIVAQPSDAHVQLASAAKWAVAASRIELLKSLLQAGVQINEPIDEDVGWTLLHFAAGVGSERMVCFLVDNGADLFSHDPSGIRPIDIAFQQGRTNICQALANTLPHASSIDGFPRGVLERIFCSQQKDPVFVSVNGKDPSDELMKWLRDIWPNASLGSKGEQATDSVAKEKKNQKSEIEEKMAICIVTIKRLSEKEYSWFLSFKSSLHSSWTDEGKVREEYGYWVVTKRQGGEF